jgi:hypothetical protein
MSLSLEASGRGRGVPKFKNGGQQTRGRREKRRRKVFKTKTCAVTDFL